MTTKVQIIGQLRGTLLIIQKLHYYRSMNPAASLLYLVTVIENTGGNHYTNTL